jgi:DNA topoisomerase-3
VAKCTDPNCGLVVFRSISEKELSDKQVLELLTKGKTAIINGFKSRAGKVFATALKFDENCRVTFDFSDRTKKFGKKQVNLPLKSHGRNGFCCYYFGF